MSRIERAEAVLGVLKQQNIQTPEALRGMASGIFGSVLDLLRIKVATIIKEKGYGTPRLIESLALTLLGKGACQELSLRMAVEYMKAYQGESVSMLFLANATVSEECTHAVVVMGDLKFDATLALGKGSQPGTIRCNKFPLITDFMKSQGNNDIVIIDPLLELTCSADNLSKDFTEYLDKNGVTHVIGVREFKNMVDLDGIRRDALRFAQEVANELRNQINLDFLGTTTQLLFSQSSSKTSWTYHATNNGFYYLATVAELNLLKSKLTEHGIDPGRVKVLEKKTPGQYVLGISRARELDPCVLYEASRKIIRECASSANLSQLFTSLGQGHLVAEGHSTSNDGKPSFGAGSK